MKKNNRKAEGETSHGLAVVAAMLPVALLTILFQRFIIGGLLAGSEKG
ncbi:MAG: hypothetical protein KAT23_00250 [Anaerolineales bacterium]|nr:hypothetical protein [Anaerolineales bacterium]